MFNYIVLESPLLLMTARALVSNLPTFLERFDIVGGGVDCCLWLLLWLATTLNAEYST